ncbi:unnamed protein product [Ranitomeya imitator]|uniref:Uncharacterized protein n=1 Tax=Ranitomeya imitator TaxID=111125 RepID=A0ABN9MHR7_9NEOB|nr:unnamed protein product [Ranitomeya imitator]
MLTCHLQIDITEENRERKTEREKRSQSDHRREGEITEREITERDITERERYHRERERDITEREITEREREITEREILQEFLSQLERDFTLLKEQIQRQTNDPTDAEITRLKCVLDSAVQKIKHKLYELRQENAKIKG